MMVCHCMQITDRDIDAAIDWMRAADPAVVITPGKVFHALGKSAECGGCVRLFVDTMKRNDNLAVPFELRNLRGESSRGRNLHSLWRDGPG
ncbi:MAG: (2Fe-2S)-binding protein [Rhodobacteraceae bacterium]|nr:(2Fe-2S)-binding protein [Paracoccaceae bacterium]